MIATKGSAASEASADGTDSVGADDVGKDRSPQPERRPTATTVARHTPG